MKKTWHTVVVLAFWSGAMAMHAQSPATPPAAQTTAPAAATPAPVDPGPLHQWGTDFSFMFDGYIEDNFNSPASGFNGLRAFDVRSDTPHLNMAMITIDHACRQPRSQRLEIFQAGLY